MVALRQGEGCAGLHESGGEWIEFLQNASGSTPKEYGQQHIITKDGVTFAEEIDLADKLENMGA
jgi:hypothetical protein